MTVAVQIYSCSSLIDLLCLTTDLYLTTDTDTLPFQRTLEDTKYR